MAILGSVYIDYFMESARVQYLRTFARKYSNIDFFSENFTIER